MLESMDSFQTPRCGMVSLKRKIRTLVALSLIRQFMMPYVFEEPLQLNFFSVHLIHHVHITVCPVKNILRHVPQESVPSCTLRNILLGGSVLRRLLIGAIVVCQGTFSYQSLVSGHQEDNELTLRNCLSWLVLRIRRDLGIRACRRGLYIPTRPILLPCKL